MEEGFEVEVEWLVVVGFIADKRLEVEGLGSNPTFSETTQE